MKRIQLFEFEDFQWIPDGVRSSMTRLLTVLIKMMGIHHIISSKVKQILQENNLSSVVDLGSGAGGAMPLIHEDIPEIKMSLSDLFPNKEAIKYVNSLPTANLHYLETPVNAVEFESAPQGLKTMINCFHHMPPIQARKIVESAYHAKQPFLIYEMAENKMPLLVWALMLPISMVIMIIMVLFMTPFVKPLTWQQLVFTYLIPIIPFLYAWDGQASMPRMYSMDDMDELLSELSSKNYSWTKEPALNDSGKAIGTFVIGLPI
tara:strand:+ start:19404 stop:20189 length:786 start_codon:yes stop_codon:yes gene_type:complete